MAVYRAYLDLIGLVHRPETRIDKIDDFLIGRTNALPSAASGENDEDPEEEEEEIKVLDQLINQLINFPSNGHGVLEGLLPNRPYSLLTLFALLGDRQLIYILCSLGVSVTDFDWTRYFSALSEEVKLILSSIRSMQRVRRPLRIPRDIQQRIREAKERREGQERQNAQAAKRPRTDSIEADTSHQTRTRSGEWIRGYFVEDYEEKEEDQARPSPLPTPIQQTGTRLTENRRQDKRARLASLHALPAQRVTTTPSPPPPPSPPIPLSTATQLLPPETQNTPFISVLVSNLPIGASPQSILFFFQHGADIFKAARTQNQRIDALGRNLHKFKPNTIQAYQQKPNGGKGGEGHRGYEVRGEDLKMVEEPTGCQAETRSVIVRFARPSGDNQQAPWEIFIQEFHNKKFFRFDSLCLPLSCRLLSS
ncbi:hypothetical protein PGT21_003484 [Puccinia graminis f. sp. tritici]|uniref:Uncharacterized protein n=1 Tax=Puccinia graminis f. sp. tritici TaxID=56615 RepID=A0A5B0REH1_PUCGR|nr:hypothetical protein PGT21_003484 [Puccinia graminis f. sp. tritici]KAA1123353.1 hypothetical protein PGTUg99_012786 [Puccinia graminis f. sp. tritici]